VTTTPPPLPRLTPESDFYWTGGAAGELRILRCESCRRYAHPPTPLCRQCGSDRLAPEAVSGRGSVWTFTVSHQQLLPSLSTPYVVAVVELEEQADLHVTTRLIDVDPDDVAVGIPVEVRFEQHDNIYLPLFAPVQR
jgi:uncharacterized OB-fold protein